jgi:hypothetical protein
LGGTWPKPGDAYPGKIQRPDKACPETDLFCFVFSGLWSGICSGKSTAQMKPAQELTCFFSFFLGSGPAFAEDFILLFYYLFFLWRWQGDDSI